MTELTFPQPLGVFGYPAGLLLVPPGDDFEPARRSLVEGRLPVEWPEGLAGHRLAHEDRVPEAALAFGGVDPVSVYNRWVLDPASADASQVRKALPARVRPLVDLVRFTIEDGAPLPTQATTVAPEVAALLFAAQSSEQIGRGDVPGAITGLSAAAALAGAAASPALAAVLRANAATLGLDIGSGTAATDLEQAVQQLADCDLPDVRAELLLRLGSHLQSSASDALAAGASGGAGQLHAAMRHYYDALALVSETSAPFLWGSLQLNLATAQLAVPMTRASDQLRMGVATQALRACRRVFDPAQHPGPWSSATLNLANALVYTPSTHRADNLLEAVQLYEEALTSGARDSDPLGRARLLTNLGNALAHLGALDDARAKLVEARFVFEEHLDHDGALTVRTILDEIAKAGIGAAEPGDHLAELARQAEQMAKLPQPSEFTSGMGVRVEPRPQPKVTVVDPATRPAESGPAVPADEDGEADER